MTNFFHQHMPGQFRWGAPPETPLAMLSLMEAATLLLYQISVNAEGQDVPIASSFSVKMSPQLYLTSALMELALHGYVQMDEVKPLQNYARYYQAHKPNRALISAFLGLFVISFLSICSTPIYPLLFQVHIALFLISFVLMLLLAIISSILTEPANRGVHGQLVVLREPPIGDAVLDEVLWRMQPMEHSRSVKDWLVSPLIVPAKDLYARIEPRLLEQGWIMLAGKQRAPLVGEVETLLINRQCPQWLRLCEHLRQALLSEGPSDPHTTALLLFLTLLPGTFQTPIQVRLPGQPAGRKMIGGLYQILSEPAEIKLARQRLRVLLNGDPAVADAIEPEIYDTLLRLRIGVEEARQQRKSRRR